MSPLAPVAKSSTSTSCPQIPPCFSGRSGRSGRKSACPVITLPGHRPAAATHPFVFFRHRRTSANKHYFFDVCRHQKKASSVFVAPQTARVVGWVKTPACRRACDSTSRQVGKRSVFVRCRVSEGVHRGRDGMRVGWPETACCARVKAHQETPCLLNAAAAPAGKARRRSSTSALCAPSER